MKLTANYGIVLVSYQMIKNIILMIWQYWTSVVRGSGVFIDSIVVNVIPLNRTSINTAGTRQPHDFLRTCILKDFALSKIYTCHTQENMTLTIRWWPVSCMSLLEMHLLWAPAVDFYLSIETGTCLLQKRWKRIDRLSSKTTHAVR